METIESFTIDYKIYGDVYKSVDRIYNTFTDRDSSTGVLLVGEKGSGKTLLSKLLIIKAAEQQLPCIIINSPWTGDKFNQLIQNIQQPCVVLFDEFEKVYEEKDQNSILTLLDGVYPSKIVFIDL